MTSFASLPFELRSQIWSYALLTNPFEGTKEATTFSSYGKNLGPRAYLSWERELSINMSGGDWVYMLPVQTLNMLKTRALTASLASEARKIFAGRYTACFDGSGLLCFLRNPQSPKTLFSEFGSEFEREHLLDLDLLRELRQQLAGNEIIKRIAFTTSYRVRDIYMAERLNLETVQVMMKNMSDLIRPT